MILIFDTDVDTIVDKVKPGKKHNSIADDKKQQEVGSDTSGANEEKQSKLLWKIPNSNKRGKTREKQVKPKIKGGI